MVENLYKNTVISGAEQAQTTVFNDGSAQWHVAFPSGEDETRGVAVHDNLNLKDFFERPVYAANYSWDPASATPFFQVIDPWSTFFNNARVANRVSNYNLLSCKLRVKIMLSGNSFYYGRLLAHYDPLANYNKVASYASGSTTVTCVQASQGLSAFIDPTESQGCEFTLPFVWFYDTLSLPEGDLSDMGKLYIRQLEFLKHANGSIDPINISVFIWAEDVSVSIPTTTNMLGITAQAGEYDDEIRTQGDEYGSSPVAAMASSMAAAAGKLSGMPMIGKYAKATSIASGAMASIAAMFGFSRPLQVENYTSMRPALISQLALTNVGDMSQKLAVDAKQELSIDPSIIGIGAPDELALVHMASQQSYLTQFAWTTTRIGGALLWEARVTPTIYDYVAPNWYVPACCFTALPFTYWRGTMRYRFQIVASAFHKGRLAITWDPYSMSGTIQPNLVYTRVIDLSNERDVIVDIPWGSTKHYLNTLALTATKSFQTAGHYAANIISTNGAISVTVVNELTSPNSTVNNDISINVYVSMCEDADFAVPNDRIRGYSYAYLAGVQTQAGEYEDTGDQPQPEAASETLEPCLPMADHSTSVYFGEKLSSFRQLIKRFAYLGPMFAPAATAGDALYELSDFPAARGFYILGLDTDGTNRVNNVYTTIMTYLAPAFIASRGGIRRKYLYNSTVASPPGYMTVSRSDPGAVIPSKGMAADVTTNSYLFSKNRVANQIGSALYGAALTSITQQPILEVELPYYKNERFDTARWPSGAAGIGGQGTLRHRLNVRQPAGTHFLDVYVAGAEDFTLIGFQGCPPISSMAF